jgi:uracil permease
MNAILPGKDFEFDEEEPSKTGVNFEMINGETLAEQLSKKKK